MGEDCLNRFQADVSVIDYWMPDFNGSEAVTNILKWMPNHMVILTSWLHGSDHIRGSIMAGAIGVFA